MTFHNWKLGPTECRDPIIGEVEILATDMDANRPLLIRTQRFGLTTWTAYTCHYNGRWRHSQDHWFDIMPPKNLK